MKIIGTDIKNEDDLREAAQKVGETRRNGKIGASVVPIASGKKPATSGNDGGGGGKRRPDPTAVRLADFIEASVSLPQAPPSDLLGSPPEQPPHSLVDTLSPLR